MSRVTAAILEACWLLAIIGMPVVSDPGMPADFQFAAVKVALLKLLTLAALPALVALLVTSPTARGRLRTPLGAALLASLLIAAASTATSRDPQFSITGSPMRQAGLEMVLCATVLAVAVLAVADTRRIRRLMTALAAVGSLAAAMGVAQHLHDPALAPSAWTGNSGMLAAFLAPTLITTVVLARRRPAWWLGAGMQMATLLATGNRAAIVAVAVVGLGYGWYRLPRRHRVPAVAMAIVVSGPLLFTVASIRMYTVAVRGELWREAVVVGLERPLLGWGPDAVRWHSAALDALEPGGLADNAHNALLDSFVHQGAAGVAAYAALVVAAVVTSVRNAVGAVGAALAAYFICSQLGVMPVEGQIAAYSLFGALGARKTI